MFINDSCVLSLIKMVTRKRKVAKALFVVAVILIAVSVALTVFSAAGLYEPASAACEGLDCVHSGGSGEIGFKITNPSGGLR